MRLYSGFIICAIIIGICTMHSCTFNKTKWVTGSFASDSTLVHHYIQTGNDITKVANPLPETFANALVYYDSALQIAQVSNNSYLLAIAHNNVGRAYEAWNQSPDKTYENFKLAIQNYRDYNKLPYDEKYTRFLLAHAYMKDKKYNESNAESDTLFAELKALPDSIKKQMDFSVLMARTYAFSGEYKKAESCLANLTKREWIINKPTTYNFLYYYYLIKAEIDVYAYNNFKTIYLDSTYNAFKQAVYLGDFTVIGNRLIDMHNKMGNSTFAQKIKATIKQRIDNLQVNEENDLRAAKIINNINVNKIKKDVALKTKALSLYQKLSILITLLALIGVALAIYLVKSNKEVKAQKEILANNILELEKKNNDIELLHKEMHHRVKNNLQTIQSLLVMQEKTTEDEYIADTMKEMRLRINSMANLHHHLLEQEKNINLSDYVKKLINNVVSLLAGKKNIITHINIDNIELPHKNVFALGLIINEWVTNSVKYAVTEKDSLICYLDIHNLDKTIQIEYHDSGKIDTTKTNTNGLGLHIVNLLTKQIEGTLNQADNNKFHYHLSLPKIEYGHL
jgi:two-component sensor histidine kinase